MEGVVVGTGISVGTGDGISVGDGDGAMVGALVGSGVVCRRVMVLGQKLTRGSVEPRAWVKKQVGGLSSDPKSTMVQFIETRKPMANVPSPSQVLHTPTSRAMPTSILLPLELTLHPRR